MPVANDQAYFDYLKNRSRLGYVYRYYWLYPLLRRWFRGRILDVGCGIGDFLRFLPSIVGVDINEKNVQWCVSQGLEAHLMERDLLPFTDASFDSVMLDNVLEHVAEPYQLLEEIKRVLKPSGRLIVGVPGTRGYRQDPDHKVFYDKHALRETLTKHGFFTERITAMPLNWNWLDSRLSQYCVYGMFIRQSND